MRRRPLPPLPLAGVASLSPPPARGRPPAMCHETSCSGARPPGLPSAASSASAFLPAPVSFRSRRRRPAGTRPFSRVSHALACARSAPARFARLIARASKRKTHFSCPFQWRFFAPTRNEAASGCRFLLPHSSMDCGESSPHSGFISLLRKIIGQDRDEGVFGHALLLTGAGRSRQGAVPEGRGGVASRHDPS